MGEHKDNQQGKKQKGFWARFIERLDKNLEKKARSSCCCTKDTPQGGSGCCQ